MRIFSFVAGIIALFLITLIAGCGNKPTDDTGSISQKLIFRSENYGFSFEYPSGMEEITKDLPDRWALLDNRKNTILFMVSKPKVKDTLAAGRLQALRDFYNDDNISNLKEEDVKKVFSVVKLENFNNETWYTYGINFNDKNADSLVSGILCDDNEIILVVVSESSHFEQNKLTYINLLNSFKC
ncbi:MAG: hypothetical protein AABX32_03505 [Nanoarchaeota archaeon]